MLGSAQLRGRQRCTSWRGGHLVPPETVSIVVPQIPVKIRGLNHNLFGPIIVEAHWPSSPSQAGLLAIYSGRLQSLLGSPAAKEP